MHSRSRKFGVLVLALVVMSAAAVWAQGYPTQDSTSSSQPQSASSSQPQSAPPPSSTADEPPPSKPDKNAPSPTTLKNIDAIGNRNVGCNTGAGNWYSLEKQVAMGQQYSQQVEHGVKLVSDPVVTEYVNRIGQNLVRNSDSKVPFTIKVIDTDEINAFALPGGFFYVNSGLILAADNEAELAGVMAHEIAHVAACHVAREQTRSNIVNLASIPLVFVPGGWAVYEATQVAMSIGVPLTFMKFSRNFESEADFLGMEYMYKTGYDPQSFISFFDRGAGEEEARCDLKGFLVAPDDSRPRHPCAAGDGHRSSSSRRVCAEHIGVRPGEVATGLDQQQAQAAERQHQRATSYLAAQHCR